MKCQRQEFWSGINLLPSKLFNWNFDSLDVVSLTRDPQLQVSENYSDLSKWRLANLADRYYVVFKLF